MLVFQFEIEINLLPNKIYLAEFKHYQLNCFSTEQLSKRKSLRLKKPNFSRQQNAGKTKVQKRKTCKYSYITQNSEYI